MSAASAGRRSPDHGHANPRGVSKGSLASTSSLVGGASPMAGPPGAALSRTSSASRLGRTGSKSGPLSATAQSAAMLSRTGSAAVFSPSSAGAGDLGAEEDDDFVRIPGGPKFRVGPRHRPAEGLLRDRAMYFIQEMEDKKATQHLEAFQNLVQAMKEFPSDLEVQTKGCFAMAYNAITHARKVLKAGGLEVVLAAMRKFPKEAKLQQEGCECLRYLTVRGDDMKRVLKAGGLDAIFLAMQNNDKAIYVQQEACGALKNISNREAQAVLNAGGLEQVMKVMDMFPKYSWAQMWGCQAIRRFSELEPKRVDDAGGFRKVVFALSKHEKIDALRWAADEALKLRPPDGQL